MFAHTHAPRIAAAAAATLLLSAAAAQAHSPLDGRISLHNDRHRPVQVTIDGEETVRLDPGQTRVLSHIPNGVRFLEVRGHRGPALSHELHVPVRGTARYEIEALRGAAAVLNDSGVPMRIAVDGRPFGLASPGQRLLADGLRPGAHKVVATPVGRGSLYPIVRSVVVEAGDESRVRLGDWHASVVVRNTTGQPARIYLDGREMDRARPGRTERLDRVEPGRHTVELRGRHGRLLARAEIDLAPGERETVQPRALEPELQVRNDRRRSVEVVIDGRHMGRLAGGESRTFTGLRPGMHRVTIVEGRGRSTQHRVRLSHGEREVLALAPRRGDRDYVARN